MAKVIITEYAWDIVNFPVYPECPYGEESKCSSKEVLCRHPKTRKEYCSEHSRKGTCPFDLHEELYGGVIMTRVIAHRCLHCGAITGRAESCPVPECCGELMAQTMAPEDMLIAENQVRAWMKKAAGARGRVAYRRPVIVEEPIPGRC